MEYKYTKIDLEKWNRGKLFQSYIDDMRIVMSLTVDIDVTNLIKFSKSHDLKFYPAMIWVVSKVVNEHDEFKYSWDNKGNLNGTIFPRPILNFIKKMRISQKRLQIFLIAYLNFTHDLC